MPESQQHGLLWESDIKSKVFNLGASASYTAVHDVDRAHNRYNPNENISIKTTGGSTLDMGSAIRVFDYEPGVEHTCIVVQYAQREAEKVLTHVYELDLMKRDALWGSITREDVMRLDSLIRSMPRDRRDPEIDQEIRRVKKELNAKSGVVRFNPKLDSHGQRRLQCSIPKFASCAPIIKTSTVEPLVRGIQIVASVLSGRRVRNRRV